MSVFTELLQICSQNWHCLLFILSFGFLIRQHLTRGLNSLPGPFFANFTDIWRLLTVRKGHFHVDITRLHRRYGKFVRIGPNTVSNPDPEAIKTIYGPGQHLTKSDFYKPFDRYGLPPHIFSVQDETAHAAMRKPIAGAYSMTTLVEYEPLVDDCIVKFMERLESEFASDFVYPKICDIHHWAQYYAFDVIAQITWGERMGFLEEGRDISDSMKALQDRQDYVSVVGQMPFLDRIFKKNPIVRHFDRSSPFFPQMAMRLIKERKANPQEKARDFLQKYLVLQEKEPDKVHFGMLVNWTMINIIAGSDTTAISIRAVLYYVLKDPAIFERLRTELEGANLSLPVSWAESQKLPYLNAVIKEALRFHPAVGLNLERVVPQAGLHLSNGMVLPEGTIVGMNAWAVHRDARIFGADADSFNPSRWLRNTESETEEQYEERLAAMKGADLTFGSGSRTCLGKNISFFGDLQGCSNVVPTLFLKFDVCLVEPKKDWKTVNYWFVRQWDMNVYLRLRK